MDLAGRVAVITGAATGIGAATARLMASRGATVVGVGLQNLHSLGGGETGSLRQDYGDRSGDDRGAGRGAAKKRALRVEPASQDADTGGHEVQLWAGVGKRGLPAGGIR